MRTIAIINQKGGCGKTTTSINLAATLAAAGHPTLLVDMDPQSHCALGLSVPETEVRTSTAELIRHGLDGTVSLDDAIWQVSRDLDLVPANMALAAVEAQLTNAPDKDRRLTHVLSAVRDRYEFCIIDCPPSIGVLTFNALRAANEVIIPVETGFFSMRGAVKQQRTIEMLAQRVGHHAEFRLLPTMYDVRTKLAREILAEIKRQFGDYVLPLVINFNAKLKEAASMGQPITEYDPASRGASDFARLAEYLLEHEPATTLMAASAHSDAAMGADNPFGELQSQPQHGGVKPAMSRAAELAERARALCARTTELSRKLSRDQDFQSEFGHDAAPAAAAAHLSNQPAAGHPFDPAPPQPAPAASPAVGYPASPHAPSSRLAHLTGNGPRLVDVERPNGHASTNGHAGAPSETDEQRQQREALERIYGVRNTRQGVLFVQPAQGELGRAHQVAIVGDFNDWSAQASPMKRNDQLGVWQAVVNVPPGKYRYGLVVDGRLAADPYNQRVETTDNGQRTNVLEIA